VKAYEAIVKGENIAEPSIPESFKVLLKEMQSLGLNVGVVSEEGEQADLGEEDDDLLRAAEELGIDLSGVRASDGAEGVSEAEQEVAAGAPEIVEPEGEEQDEDSEVRAEDLLSDDIEAVGLEGELEGIEPVDELDETN
jgi:DNA-directed RNA polymerase subunit beta